MCVCMRGVHASQVVMFACIYGYFLSICILFLSVCILVGMCLKELWSKPAIIHTHTHTHIHSHTHIYMQLTLSTFRCADTSCSCGLRS